MFLLLTLQSQSFSDQAAFVSEARGCRELSISLETQEMTGMPEPKAVCSLGCSRLW